MLANYQQTKISAPPNLLEPIGFDVLPDGRVIQTARAGTVRLHDPATGTTKVIATLPVYTNSEDGLYGPAIDNDFATNKWVYLYYAPPTVRIQRCDGTMADVTTPTGSAPTTGADPCIWQDVWAGYFQLSRFKFVDGANPTLDLSTEQKIMQVANNRGACCHVAGDIDFDKHNNLWLVTGDDTPSGGGNSGGFAPFNDQKTNESQTIRVNNATGGTFTLTFDGQTTAPIAFNATNAVTQAALEALSNIDPGDVLVTGNAVNTANQTVAFRGQHAETNVAQITGDAAGLTGTGTPAVATATSVGGRPVQRSVRRRAPLGGQHERPARQGPADQRRGGRLVHEPDRQPVPRVRGPGRQDAAGDLRDGLPEPVPDPGRRERRRVRDGLLAGLAGPAELPRTGRRRPRGDRPQAVQLRLADLPGNDPALLQVELQHLHAAEPGQPGEVRVRQPGPWRGEHVALEHRPDPDCRR